MNMTSGKLMLLSGAIGAAAVLGGDAQGAAARSPSGIQTVFLPPGDSPLVAVRAVFRTGAIDDPAGKEGLALLTADVISEGGNGTMTYPELLDALYPMAAGISSFADKDATVFGSTVHRDNLPRFVELFAAQIMTPRFAPEDFARAKQNAIDYLTNALRGNNDENLGKQALGTLMHAGTVYGHPSRGTVAGVTAITIDDVKTFYREHYTRDRLIVGLAGGYDSAFGATFAAMFAPLPAKGAPATKLPSCPARKQMEVLLVEKGARACAISIGHPISITRSDADFYPLTLARSYLGEHRTFNGRLQNEMRQKRGLNYGNYAYVENFIEQPGARFARSNIPRRRQHFEIWLRPVAPHNTAFALRQALYETEKLVRDGIPQDGFEASRSFLLNYSNLWTQDAASRLGYAIDARIYGKDVIKELQARLPKMKKADVDRVVRKYLDPKHVAVTIVTAKAADLRAKLLSGAPTPITYDTAGTPQDILDEDKRIEAYPLPLTDGNVTITPVDKMFDK